MRAFLAMLTVLWAGLALADGFGIAAVVDDQVVSTVDVNDRTSLVMGMTNIPGTPENRARITPQVLRQLIDEKLQMEEATRDGISISDPKLREGIAKVEAQNGKAPGSLEQFVSAKGLSRLSLYAQVRAQMAWAEVIMKKVRPKIRISDREVASYVRRKETAAPSAVAQAGRAPQGGPEGRVEEVLIATIHLAVDSPRDEASVRKLADKLAGSIRSGSSFESVASQFSSHTSVKAIDPFWVEPSQVDPAIAAALAGIQKGGITDPVRTSTGYQIIKLMDVRRSKEPEQPQAPASAQAPAPAQAAPGGEVRAELAFKQILMTLKPDAKPKEAELLLSLAKEVQKNPGRCEEKTMGGVGDLADMDFRVTLTRALSDNLPERLRDFLMKLRVGDASDPVITPQGIRLFMLCERVDLPPEKPGAASPAGDDSIRQALYQEKLELEAQKYMRNLRREAFIEIRGAQ